MGPIDDECHFVTTCIDGQIDRSVMYKEVSSRNIKFLGLCSIDKFKMLVCPTAAIDSIIVSSFLETSFKRREQIDYGTLKV